MPLYPLCVLADVSAKNLHRTYDASSNPTNTQVVQYTLDIYSQILGIITSAGYDSDNLHETSSTIAEAITAGAVTPDFADATGFAKGDIIKLEGLTSGVRAWEFAEITNISGNTVSFTAANSYDANGVNVYLVNGALASLREINAVGAAWKAEESTFMKTAPNRSEHAETLKESFFGTEETLSGLWAIMNIPDYLIGATQLDTAEEQTSQITSYGSENSDDSDTEPMSEIDYKF